MCWRWSAADRQKRAQLSPSTFVLLLDRMPNIRSFDIANIKVWVTFFIKFTHYSLIVFRQNTQTNRSHTYMAVFTRFTYWIDKKWIRHRNVTEIGVETICASIIRIRWRRRRHYQYADINTVLYHSSDSILYSFSCLQSLADYHCISLTHIDLTPLDDTGVFALTKCTNLSILSLSCEYLNDTSLTYIKVSHY